MANLIGKAQETMTYDAIVVGSGISGGWAAMELCKAGLKTLLLERGRNVEHITDYTTAFKHTWDFRHRQHFSTSYRDKNPIQCSIADESTSMFFANDEDHPYIQETPFAWYRGYQVGGRSLTWGRQCYRLSDLDFEANLKDDIAVDWPIRYREIAPWYDYVESFVGISGRAEGLAQLPDGKFLPPMELNCIEKHLAQTIKQNYDNRILTIARVANLTQGWEGRGPCRYRNLCMRGCPYGGYFSSNSATIPAAAATGNLVLRPFSIVAEVVYDGESGRATGVRVVDALTKEEVVFYAKVIFLNASTINTAAILLQSRSARFPDGLGNDSGQVGHNLMDHHSFAGAYGIHEGFADQYYKGRRPCGFLIPRFRNLLPDERHNFIRGYNFQGVGERQNWMDASASQKGFGEDFKQRLTAPGPWGVWMAGWGECLPYHSNRISLSEDQRDQWGMPLVKINFHFRENEHRMMADIETTAQEMLAGAGFRFVEPFRREAPGGSTIHEMGTARMGRDPKTSVLNGFNQMHAVPNVFVTDGSCMTSSSSQNPSLTYMALTARACNYAVALLKQGKL